MEEANLFPYRLSKVKNIWESLVGDEAPQSSPHKLFDSNAGDSDTEVDSSRGSLDGLSNTNPFDDEDESPSSASSSSSVSSQAPTPEQPKQAEEPKEDVPPAAVASESKGKEKRSSSNLAGAIFSLGEDSSPGHAQDPSLDYHNQLVGALLEILLKSQKYRIITLQMAIHVLKELVYSEEMPAKLTSDQHEQLQVVYDMSAGRLRDKFLQCNHGDLMFELERFEEEIRTFRRANFEHLVTDASLLLPIPEAPTPGCGMLYTYFQLSH
jgi:hypothetical protein